MRIRFYQGSVDFQQVSSLSKLTIISCHLMWTKCCEESVSFQQVSSFWTFVTLNICNNTNQVLPRISWFSTGIITLWIHHHILPFNVNQVSWIISQFSTGIITFWIHHHILPFIANQVVKFQQVASLYIRNLSVFNSIYCTFLII